MKVDWQWAGTVYGGAAFNFGVVTAGFGIAWSQPIRAAVGFAVCLLGLRLSRGHPFWWAEPVEQRNA